MSGIAIRGVAKSFGEARALDGVSLDVAEGELMVFVGPSGCGKTTLLRIVAGLETACEGEVAIRGEPMGDRPAKDRDVAMVFQNYALYPHMDAAENIGFGLRMRGVRPPERRARVEGVADMLGLGRLLGRRPAELSGGQRQRVAMGRAVARRPAAFLMDEPLSNLDAELRARVRREIKLLQRELGVTTVHVTHDQVEAMTLGHRVAVFREGRLQQVGPPEAIYARPANLFVGGFLGSPPMGLLPCRREGGQLVAPGLSGAAAPPGLAAEAVTLGLRAEHLRPGAGPVTWSGTVALVEPLGGETLVHLERGDASLTLRLPPGRRVAEGEALSVALGLEAAHLFGPDGARIDPAPTEAAA